MDIDDLYGKFKETKGAVTDTRKDLLGKMFFALRGPNFNGNTYADQAISNGAKFAIVDEKNIANGENVILVDSVLETLQLLGAMHKKSLGIPVIGITGTNGKTTNKELLGRILSKTYKCYSTKGNLNNHIGVPLSLLEIESSHDIAIIEMGANKMGDIKELCEISDPDFGLITNIGTAHLEGFVSKENIKKEKGELFRYIQHKGGVFFVNTSEAEVFEIAENYEKNVLIGESESNTFQFEWRSSIPEVNLVYRDHLITSSLYGKHNYENIKMAAGIGLYFNVPISEICEAIGEYESDNNRSQIIKKNGLVIFMDAYNANPSSMKSSIESFARFNAIKKRLILGDMLEMGEQSYSEHLEILQVLRAFEWESVVLIGHNFMQFKDQFLDFQFFESKEDADSLLLKPISKDTHILIKGSRGQALEKLQFIQRLQ